jgi:plastocyanin
MQSALVESHVLASVAPKRRRLPVRGIPAVLAAAVTIVAAALAVVAWPQPAATYEPQTREFTLVASEFDWALQDGSVVRAWGYNGQVGGPEIRVREGDLVRVTLKNELPVPTTIHWHGVMVPPAMDGPAGLNQEAVEPGDTFVYEFVATPAGTRMYHSHTDVVNQIALGLYGAFIVEPAQPETDYDKEFTYLLSEWDLELTPRVAQGLDPRGPRDTQLRGGELGADLFLLNGHTNEAIPPISVAEGDRVLIRLINMGNVGHPFHLHGHLFKIVATDGNPVPAAAQLTKDTVWIAPGERYDLELVADSPGVWMVHCHIENHAANGMMTVIAYDGVLPTGPLAEIWDSTASSAPMDHSMHGSADVQPAENGSTTTQSEPTLAATSESSPAAANAAGETITVEMVDDRFGPKTLEVQAGTTIVFVNNGHNAHTVAAKDGSFTSGQIKAGERFTVTVATPGEIVIVCRNHLRQGMTGRIIVS